MHMVHLMRKLGRTDLKLIGRDRFLLLMFGFVLYIAVVLRFGLPWLNAYFAEQAILPSETLALHLADLYPMLVTFFALFNGALIAGTIVGFMLIDEKDHNTLKAMLVTPVPLRHYVMYRVGIPTLLSFFVVLGMVLLINQALIPLGSLLLIAAGASLTAPIIALFYAIFAANKVQGFAMAKFVGIFGWTILIGWFVAEPWQWLFGLFPPFLISKAYWMAFAGESGWWGTLLAGVVLQVGLIAVQVQQFKRIAYR